MSFPQPNVYHFRVGDTKLKGAEATAYKNALALKAEVEGARAQEAGGTELFIQQPQDFQQFPQTGFFDAKTTLLNITKQDNGELRGFTKNDSNAATQYRLSKDMAASMVGGMGGALLAGIDPNKDLFQSHVRNEDGSSTTRTLRIDKTSGLMDYTEWEMPKLGS